MSDKIDYDSVPVGYMAGAMQRYVEHGLEPGSFLMAMLSGDLYAAMGRADSQNIDNIGNWCKWIERNLPPTAYGDPRTVRAWCAAKTRQIEEN
jgi:hypothetical protein